MGRTANPQEPAGNRIVLNITQAAELLGVPEVSIRTWTSAKKIPAHHIGGRVFYNRLELLKLVGGTSSLQPDSDPVLTYLLEKINERRKELAEQQT